MARKVYKKTFEAYEFFEELEMPIMGGVSEKHPLSVMSIPLEMSLPIRELNERLQKEITAFEEEEGDINIFNRAPRLTIVATLNDGNEYKPAFCLEVEVSFHHHEDKEV